MTAPTGRALGVPQWTTADRLRKIRREAGLTGAEMATLLGYSPKRYEAWENGRNRPTDPVELARKIQDTLGVPASWTLGLDTSGGRNGVRHAVTQTYMLRSRGPRTRLHRPDRVSVTAS